MEEYISVVAKNTELFSQSDADTILDCLLAYAEELGYKEYTLSKDKYKLKLPILNAKN